MSLPQQSYGLDSSKDYPFVQSTEEHDRLDQQSIGINELMFGRFSHAPLESPMKILDVGCGTGIQTMLLAKLYPNAMIIGIDPNVVPNNPDKPDNVVYLLGKIEELAGKHEQLQAESFDLVYQRYLVMVVADWTAHIELTRSLLKPHGWFESQETSFYDVYNAQERLISSDWRFPSICLRDSEERQIDFRIGNKLSQILPTIGFDNVLSEAYPMPFRPGWKENPQTEGIGRYHEWACPPLMHMLARRAAARSGDDPDELIQESDEKLLQGPIGTHCKLNVTVGRKVQ